MKSCLNSVTWLFFYSASQSSTESPTNLSVYSYATLPGQSPLHSDSGGDNEPLNWCMSAAGAPSVGGGARARSDSDVVDSGVSVMERYCIYWLNLFRPYVKRAHKSQALSLKQSIEAIIFGMQWQSQKMQCVIWHNIWWLLQEPVWALTDTDRQLQVLSIKKANFKLQDQS